MKKLRNFGKPYTMGLIKELLIGLIILTFLTAFSKADMLEGDYFSLNRDVLSQYVSTGSCFIFANSTCGRGLSFVDGNGVEIFHGDSSFIYAYNYYCTNTGGYIKLSTNACAGQIFQGIKNCPECEVCETCPEVDTGAILSGYVSVNDINMSYCIGNNLCPEMSGGYSALYINNIRHESMPFINITIPEEFNWDYNYTGNNTQFDLTVLGYNTDSDYIAGIINTQNSKPNSTDFTNIVSGLIPLLIPGLVIILFIWFVFRFIKKIF